MPLATGAGRWIAGGGVSVLLLTSACSDLKITNVPTEAVAAASPVATTVSAAPVPFDLAVTAIDIEKRATGAGFVLLAVIENKGTQAASRIQVEGRLYDGTGKELLLKKTESIEWLAAGESKVFRTTATKPLPLRDGYLVRVEAIAVPGELSLSNNTRVLRAQVQLTDGS